MYNLINSVKSKDGVKNIIIEFKSINLPVFR